MSDLRELYQQLIIDHGRNPRHFGELASASHIKDGHNPLCGDRLTLFLRIEENKITEIKFKGEGCAISMASASLMCQTLQGQSKESAEHLFNLFHQLVTENKITENKALGKLVVLGGVAEYPARVKCATLCWHTLIAATTE